MMAGAALLSAFAASASMVGGALRPADAAQAAQANDAEARLLPLGKEVPDFTLPRVDGGEVALANLLKTYKVVLIEFWGIEPEEGGEDMTKLQKLHESLHDKGLAVVAINPRDEAADIKDHIGDGKLTFPVAIDGKATNRAVTNVYKARTLPTVYLIDKSGKALWRGIGYKEAAIKEALDKAGVK